MRRFLAYFNPLFLGLILGMIFLAVAHLSATLKRQEVRARTQAIGSTTLEISMSLVRCAREQECAFRK
jgi:hypothetical protein